MCETHSTTLVPIPDFILNDSDCTQAGYDESVFDGGEYAYDDQGRKCFCIDSCLVPILELLWSKGIKTHGCCCGHGTGNGVIGLQTFYDSHRDLAHLSLPPYTISEVVLERRRENDAYYRGIHDALVFVGREDIALAVLKPGMQDRPLDEISRDDFSKQVMKLAGTWKDEYGE